MTTIQLRLTSFHKLYKNHPHYLIGTQESFRVFHVHIELQLFTSLEQVQSSRNQLLNWWFFLCGQRKLVVSYFKADCVFPKEFDFWTSNKKRFKNYWYFIIAITTSCLPNVTHMCLFWKFDPNIVCKHSKQTASVLLLAPCHGISDIYKKQNYLSWYGLLFTVLVVTYTTMVVCMMTMGWTRMTFPAFLTSLQ